MDNLKENIEKNIEENDDGFVIIDDSETTPPPSFWRDMLQDSGMMLLFTTIRATTFTTFTTGLIFRNRTGWLRQINSVSFKICQRFTGGQARL